MIEERERKAMSGWFMLPTLLLGMLVCSGLFLASVADKSPGPGLVLFPLLGFICFVLLWGLFVVNPNEAVVMQFFGSYAGTVKLPGLRWANPFYSKSRLSLRVRNFESAKLKVNDKDGNPIEIGAVVVWKVVETAQATFEVDDYEDFVHIQSEAALRNLASLYPYDAHVEGEVSLRGNTDQVARNLKSEIQKRLGQAGVQVQEARISHLAYAAEIASAMLQRQQASAIVAARSKIVEGAVGMVEMALAMLSSKGIVQLEPTEKAQLVSNLLVVLCGEKGTQPVVNTSADGGRKG